MFDKQPIADLKINTFVKNKIMKKILLSIFVFVATQTSFAQEIKWIPFDEALKMQTKTPKPIFMDVYTDWCGPCKMLDKNTFHDKAVVEFISKNYYPVKFNAEGNSEFTYKKQKYTNKNYVETQKGRNSTHAFTEFLQLQGYPTMVIFDKKGTIANKIVGYYTAEELIKELKK